MATEDWQPYRAGVTHLSDLRIVLLGNRESGKSSAGSIILGGEEFDPDVRTLQCVKRQGEVAGRQVTVVDTPGWMDCDNIYLKDSPNFLKQEIALSVTVCPPGPHAFLLVIHESMTFTEAERGATLEHLRILGQGAWKHCLVLFIQETPAEEKTFEIKGKMLQWLVKKCGNRHHVLNLNSKNNAQVNALLEKTEEMVAGNSGLCYEINREILQEIEERREEEDMRAQERRRETQSRRQSFITGMGDTALPELRIVLLGFNDAGKSSSGNTILGRKEFQPGRRSAVCVKKQGEVAGRQVTVVEATGWRVRHFLFETPEIVKREIVLSYGLCNEGPHGFCFVIRVDVHFSQLHMQSLQQHLTLLSEGIWSHTMVLFTHGDLLGERTIEQHIESEGESLKWLISKCGNRYHVLNNKIMRDTSQVTQLMDIIEEMFQKNGRCHIKMSDGLLEYFENRKKTEETMAEERRMMIKTQRNGIRLSAGQIYQSSLRIVLLGFKYSGKSSTGNTILGKDVFELCSTPKCEKREGEVAGRQVTVVDTPSGWWLGAASPSQLFKQETAQSVSLCHPGSHLFLLLIRIEKSFTTTYKQHIQDYLTLFSGDIWKHCMVLFTCGDWLGDTPIEQYIVSEGVDLSWLIERCGHRYHVLNNKNRTDITQVTELLEKIEEMIAQNNGCHYEMDRERLKELEENTEKEEMRAKERLKKLEMQRQQLQSLKRKSLSLSEIRVVLLGQRSAGKSSSGNTILGREAFELKKKTAQCVKRQGEVAGRQVTVVEAPGWWRWLEHTAEFKKQEILLSVGLCPPGPHVMLLLIGIDQFFRNAKDKIPKFLELFGEGVWSHTIVLFTYGDRLGDMTIEQYIESEDHISYLVDKCGNRYHVLNNHNSTDDRQVTQLLEKIEETVAGNSGRPFDIDSKRLQKIQERKKKQEERAKNREMRVKKQTHLQPVMHHLPQTSPLSEIRVVLLGHRQSGKSSTGNNILGREAFDLRQVLQCVKRQGEVVGRQVTVVKAPGWWNYDQFKYTPEFVKEEIILSMSLCPPGPHAVLLVLQMDLTIPLELIKYIELISERVLSHTIVLFTHGDLLGDIIIEQYIESEEVLRYLIEKCGNRYHVLNNKNRTDDQVTELLEKIRTMVAGNNVSHFEIDRKILDGIKERRKQQRKNAEDREVHVYRQKATLTFSLAGDVPRLSEVRIVLLGCFGAGKTSSGNSILGREAFKCFHKSTVCVKKHGEVLGRHVTVVDTPGWLKNGNLMDTPDITKQQIILSTSLCPPHAVLLVVGLDSSFTELQKRSVQDHLELLGKHIWRHTIILFTYGDWLRDTTIEQHILIEGECLQWLTEKCGNRYHVINNKNKRDDVQRRELLEKIDEMVIKNGDFHNQQGQGEKMLMPFFGVEADDRFDVTSVISAFRKPILDTASEAAANSMITPPMMGEDDRSSIMSAHHKPISDSASEVPSEQYTMISAANSMITPPFMGGDDRSDITSVPSGYHTYISDTASEAPSGRHSVMSAATSSGIGSSRSERLEINKKHNKSDTKDKASSAQGAIQKKRDQSGPCKVS